MKKVNILLIPVWYRMYFNSNFTTHSLSHVPVLVFPVVDIKPPGEKTRELAGDLFPFLDESDKP